MKFIRKQLLKRVTTFALTLASVLSIQTVSVSAITSTKSQISDGTYAIKLHDDKNKAVNVIYASKQEDKAEIGVDPYNGENNEKFKIVHRGNRYYSIHPTHAENLCVNALLGNKNPGDKVTLHHYENGDNCSLWSFHKYSDGTYAIKNKHTGLVLDVTNGNYQTGNRIINWTSNDYQRAQAYYLIRLDGELSLEGSSNLTALGPVDIMKNDGRESFTDASYAIKLHDDTSKAVNVIYASKQEDKAEIGVDPYNSEKNEIFILKHRGNSYYSIHPSHASYLCINALLGNKNPGDKVTLHRYEDGDNCSLWGFYRNFDGTYTIKNKHTGLVLDVTNGNYQTGNRIINWTANNYMRAQGFHIVKVSSSSTIEQSTTVKTSTNSGVTYATYNGVDYRKYTSNQKRITALDKAKKMVTVQWQAPCDFVTWASSKGSLNRVKAIDGYTDTKFKKGKTYTGIPYSMNKRTYDDEKWIKLLNNGITTNGMKAKYSSYPVAGTKYGIDCSAFVCRAYEEATGANPGLNTNGMLNSKKFKKLNSFSELKPGDVFLKSGHVMMYVGKSGSKYAVFESDAGDSKCSYNTYTQNWLSSNGYKAYKYTGFND